MCIDTIGVEIMSIYSLFDEIFEFVVSGFMNRHHLSHVEEPAKLHYLKIREYDAVLHSILYSSVRSFLVIPYLKFMFS